MPKQKTDDLIQLISSLTRAEKRHFRLFVKRNQASEDILFLKLFDFLEKKKEYDEELILKRLEGIKKRQLSNLKAHLYKQLLISLRLLSTKHVPDIQIRESVDYARVLYNKGLYRQSLDVLDKAKSKAKEGCYHAQSMEILEFEKHIEGQYITRSIEGRAEKLSKETSEVADIIYRENAYSNLSLQLYGLYLKVGYVRDEKDTIFVREFFSSQMPRYKFKDLEFSGKIHFCQAHVWYFHMTQEFAYCYRHAQRWVDLFEQQPAMIEHHTSLYLKGLHNLLNTLFNVLNYQKFRSTLDKLLGFAQEYDLSRNKNVEGLFYLFKYIHSIKKHFMEGTFTEGTKLIPELVEIIEEDRYNWDNHRIMVFYYRIASMYFGSSNFDQAITYLNLIINQKNPDYRGDIQAFARILNLISHFELGNTQLVEYQVKSVYRFLGKMNDLGDVQKEIFRFVRRIPRIQENELKKEFVNLRDKLSILRENPFEQRPFLYLDIISWLESKIENRPVEDVIRDKFLARQSR
ncbi:MAG: hypothetical protein HRU40_13795 [Saprospiraceae bacterium]|nr:hypothetical protein [Saprospiraceae bacterium]